MQRQQGIHRGVMIWDQTLERLSGKEDCGTVLESDPGKQNHEMKDCNGKHPAIVELDEEPR